MKLGKQGKINQKANRELKEVYKDRPYKCEAELSNCVSTSFIGVAHRHKRVWYYKHPELLSIFNQTILACQPCHQELERNKELTERTFERLRGSEDKILA